MRKPFAVAMAAIIVGLSGCGAAPNDVNLGITIPASLAARSQRVAYSGAPPVIPHARQSGKCIRCHNDVGARTPGIGSGLAPANPHLQTPGMSDQSRCRQCHVFSQTPENFRDNAFVGLKLPTHGDQAFKGAPPVIPHHQFMRENCRSCHAGEAARPEIRCTHSERARCVQCHVKQSGNEGLDLADVK